MIGKSKFPRYRLWRKLVNWGVETGVKRPCKSAELNVQSENIITIELSDYGQLAMPAINFRAIYDTEWYLSTGVKKICRIVRAFVKITSRDLWYCET